MNRKSYNTFIWILIILTILINHWIIIDSLRYYEQERYFFLVWNILLSLFNYYNICKGYKTLNEE